MRRRWLKGLLPGLGLAMAWLSAAPAQTPTDLPQTPVLLTADEMAFDREAGVIVARGNVEISQGERTIIADEVTYNQNTGVVTATGGVTLEEPGGELIFSDRVVLSDSLREGVIENIGMLFPDQTRFAANGAVRTGGNRTEMARAVFSPCSLCEEDPTRPPLWQIRARRVVHDQEAQNIDYTDATMEIYGVPVAYAPFFSHPDPTVDRRSGFLAPSFGNDDDLGFSVRPRYFWAISEDWDATFSPIFPTRELPVGVVELQHRFPDGKFQLETSLTRSERIQGTGGQARGHVFSELRYDIDNTWRTGWDVALASDDTYLRRYNISTSDTLTERTTAASETLITRAFAEGLRGRNYASVEGFYFQGLRAGEPQGSIPFVTPLVNYNFVSQPLRNGSRWNFDLNAMALSRLEGTDSRRLSATGGWQMPFIGRMGDIYTLTASLQTDLYWVNNVLRTSTTAGDFSGLTGRVFPQVILDWRWPLVRELGNVRQLLEPRVALIIGRNGQNDSRIPNEDSIDFEFDDTYLFSANRFPGLDRVDGGTRVVYGLGTAFYGDSGGRTELFIGQSFRRRDDDTFARGSGLEGNFSDFVGRVDINPADYVDLLYRFRLDRQTLAPRRHEVQFAAGPPSFRVGVDYLFFDANASNPEFGTREEVTARARVQLTQFWSVAARTRWDLSDDGGPLEHGASLTYQDECILVTSDLSRRFTSDRDVDASTEFFVRVVFKLLGEVETPN